MRFRVNLAPLVADAGRETLRKGPARFTMGMPKRSAPLTDPPKERPLPTSRSVLTRPASGCRAATGAGRAGGAPALPDPSSGARSARAARSWLDVALGGARIDRAEPRDRAAVEDRRARRGEAVGDRGARPSRRSARRRAPARRKQTIASVAGETTSQPGRARAARLGVLGERDAAWRSRPGRRRGRTRCSDSQSFSAREPRVSCGPRSRNSTTPPLVSRR